jgi:hypothetical protein
MIQMQLGDHGYWPTLTCALCTHAVVRSGYVLWTVDPTTALPNSAPFLTDPDCREPFAAQWPDVTRGQ